MSKTPKFEGEAEYVPGPSFDKNGDLVMPEAKTLAFIANWVRALTIQQDELPGDAELVRRVMGFSEIESLFNAPAILPDQAYRSGISAAQDAFEAGLDDAEADLDVLTEGAEIDSNGIVTENDGGAIIGFDVDNDDEEE